MVRALAFLAAWGAASAVGQETPKTESAESLVRKAVAAVGGEDKLLRVFRMKDELYLGASQKPIMRVGFLEPPGFWWEGKVNRSVEQKEPARFLVWTWTLGSLVDPKSKVTTLPDVDLDGQPAFGLRVAGTIEPPLDAYFLRKHAKLAEIRWRDSRHVFSDWRQVDGVWYAAKCAGFRPKAKDAWYRTTIVEIERLKELPKR